MKVEIFLLRRDNKMFVAYCPENGRCRIKGSRELKKLLHSQTLRIDLTPCSILEISGNKIVYLHGEVTEQGQVIVRFHNMVSTEKKMIELFYEACLAAKSDLIIHLTGETGTGKELLAKAIHDISGRKSFLPINCASIPSELIDTELFGHLKGAFTGAIEKKEGAFFSACNGTLFLDEIGEIPLSVQAKLLRTIETGEIRRIGEMRIGKSNARVITSSNRDLYLDVLSGNFRADLYYRICGLTLKLLPLKERKEDIEIIASDILKEFTNEQDYRINPDAMEKLKAYNWSGNIRELKNCLKRAIIRCSGTEIEVNDIELQPQRTQSYGEYKQVMARICDGCSRELTAEEIRVIKEISRNGGRKNSALKNLGIPRSTFYKNTFPRPKMKGLV